MKVVVAFLALVAVAVAAPAPAPQSGSVVTATVTGTSSGNGLQLLGGAALASNQKVGFQNIQIEHNHAQAQNHIITIPGIPGFPNRG